MKKQGYILLMTALMLLFSSVSLSASVLKDKFVYARGETVTFDLGDYPEGTQLVLRCLSDKDEPVITGITEAPYAWTVPSDMEPCAVSVYVRTAGDVERYDTYFRITTPEMLTTYRISHEKYKGLDVYSLDGGMSAEYAVQKSLSNLTYGISHTWHIGPGGGPAPVWGAPDFLERSVQHTVDLYDRYLGKSKKIKTVIISTGIPSVPYLSAVMQAPVLPVHFLVSVNSTKEIRSVLDYSSDRGMPSYATLGYDGSMSDVGVAWIKMLSLPEPYRKFIEDHQVENVIIAGVGEAARGESFCRRLRGSGVDGKEYSDGSVYILYTQSGSERDIRTISNNIFDYATADLEEGRFLADWESAVTSWQVEGISDGVSGSTSAKAWSLIADNDMMDMYNLSVNLSMDFITRNRQVTGKSYNGTFMNEYLISQPIYEMTHGYVPLLYWQFSSRKRTLSRIDNDIRKVVDMYEPGAVLEDHMVRVNARIGKQEYVNVLRSRGYAEVVPRNDGIEEVWDLSDGINAPCEEIAEDIACGMGAGRFRRMCRKAEYLDVDDIRMLAERLPGCTFSSCDDHVLFKDGKSSYTIVIDADAPASEQYAARELQTWILKVSGVKIPIGGLSDGEPGKRLIVGYNSIIRDLMQGAPGPEERNDSFTWCSRGGDLLFWGGSRRGTLYGVYSFLEEGLGCRWYSSKVSVAPERNEWSFCRLYHHEEPAFLIRDNCVRDVLNHADFSARMRINAIPLPDTVNGGLIPGTSEGYWAVHAMSRYITPEEHFEEHPEYFSLVDGKRIGEKGAYQLCLSNPEVLEICIERLKKAMRDNPDRLVYSMEQLDNSNPCQCGECQALVRKYGGESGIMLWFVNQVADAVKEEFPDKYVGTFAYKYTRRPPVGIVPRDNVVVRLCSIECCLLHEYDACEQNASFLEDLRAWSEIAPHLFIWDYVTDFNLYCLPVANFRTIQPHILDFRDNNAIGILEQGDYQTTSAEFKELRTYLLSKLMWNPDADVDYLIRDFTDGYYGAAGPYIREYIEYADGYLRRQGMHTDCYATVYHDMYTSEFVREGRRIFAQAKQAVSSQPEYLEHVETAELPLCFLQMAHSPFEGFETGADSLFNEIIRRDEVHMLNEWDSFPISMYRDYMDRVSRNMKDAPVMPAVEAEISGNGISYTRYEGDFLSTEAMLRNGVVTGKGVMPAIEVESDPGTDGFGYEFDGYINVLQDGVHIFHVTTDDGAVLFIDGKEVFNRDGAHASRSDWAVLNLEKGLHRFTLRYFDYYDAQVLDVRLITPDGYSGRLSSDRLFH